MTDYLAHVRFLAAEDAPRAAPQLIGRWHTRDQVSASSHLTVREVLAIRQWAAAHQGLTVGRQARRLAPVFQVSPATVRAVIHRQSWSRV